ncbi:hypothetical protein [Sorangium cellulosum]|uniref:hypothetical protein n=1 Tax=Sorangium TaxID=39643 RepID=UPI000AA0263C|nr:hypothetical protein [Sorangium cellulosum]
MFHRTASLLAAMAAAALVAACDRNPGEDVVQAGKESQEETARIQREADRKVAEARREADQKIADARKKAGEEKAGAQKDVAEERRELQEALKSAQQDTKEEYIEYARKRARLLELRAAELRAQAPTMPAADRGPVDQGLQDIEAKHREVIGTLDELSKDTKQPWSSAKADIDKKLSELEQRIDAVGGTATMKPTTPAK